MSETLILNGKDLTLEDLYSVVYDRRPVQIDPEVIPLVDKSRQVLFDMAADGKPVYGLNHGVGWNKDREFSQDFFEQYNRNLINSHSLGFCAVCQRRRSARDDVHPPQHRPLRPHGYRLEHS